MTTLTTTTWDAIPITLLDGQHHVRFVHGAVKRLEAEVGKPFEEFLLDADNKETAIQLLWCGLLHETPDLTLEALENLVDVRMYPAIRLALIEAFTGQVVDPEGNAQGAAPAGAVPQSQ